MENGQRNSRPYGYVLGTGRGHTTISAVARGPTRIEINHQYQPERPLAWANPALMNASVIQPTTLMPVVELKVVSLPVVVRGHRFAA
jgi:hypothetical protein